MRSRKRRPNSVANILFILSVFWLFIFVSNAIKYTTSEATTATVVEYKGESREGVAPGRKTITINKQAYVIVYTLNDTDYTVEYTTVDNTVLKPGDTVTVRVHSKAPTYIVEITLGGVILSGTIAVIIFLLSIKARIVVLY